MNPRPLKSFQDIDATMSQYNTPGLAAAITLFILDNQSQPGRDDYARFSLPPSYSRLDIWPHIKCIYPPLNPFYAAQKRLIRCNPPLECPHRPGIFDRILVEVAPQRSGMESKHIMFMPLYLRMK